MKFCKTVIAAFMVTVVASGQNSHSPDELLNRIRAGDRQQVEVLLRAGADPDSRDEVGTTALMQAVAFASPEIVHLLLDAGADSALTDRSGTTALMWATHDVETVRLLIRSGADVNAVRPDGLTPLVTAAIRGNVDVVGLLLESGANPAEGTVLAPWPMTLSDIAYTTNDDALRQLLVDEGVRPPVMPAPTPKPPPLSTWLMTSVFSWRPQPAATDKDLVAALLDAGADPNETVQQLTLSASALARVARGGDVEAVRVLLDRGADPNTSGSSGWTPLMAATLAEDSAVTVKLLLERGARVDAQDDAGRTALDWALAKGESETARALRDAGAREMVQSEPRRPAVEPRPARIAIALALNHLQSAVKGFNDKVSCISCHNDSLPGVAITRASEKGIPVDPTSVALSTAATLNVWSQARENLLAGNCSVFGFIQNVSYGMLELAEAAVGQNAATDAAISCLSGLQRPDGSWLGSDGRPPLAAHSRFVYTALAVRALGIYAPPGRSLDASARIARAQAFLRRTAAEGTQDEAFRLLGLVWAGAPPAEIDAQSERLQALQRPDGGWGQYPGMPADSYATGQALYALQTSGLEAASPIYANGVRFLLSTQLDDGTWHMQSRAMGFQPYVDTGFPHGPDQFISAAATAWAVIALAYAL